LRQSMARQQESEGLKEMILLAMGEGLYRTDLDGIITFMNPSGAAMTGWTVDELVGKPAHRTLHHTRRDGSDFPKTECPLYATFTDGKEHRSDDEIFWRRDGSPFDVALVSTPVFVEGELTGAVVVFSDNSERKLGERRIRETVEQLRELNRQLEEAQNQLLQSEKMASIGQLAAGVAHEINNPVGFVNSNLGTLRKYSEQMLALIAVYQSAESQLTDSELLARLAELKEALDIEFLQEDLPALIRESEEGLGRVKKIVQDLKDFSHVNESEWLLADLNAGLESTLNVVWNEVKYKANVVKQYGQIPPVECLAAQLNQVFMNLIVNAVHALDESKGMGTLTLATGQQGDEVWVEVRDTGRGMTEEVKRRIFEPFYTTKPVGKGTGLGLSLSFSILQKHHGRFDVESVVGEGSRFRVWVPVKRPGGESVS
jgi:two-component system, NtrC family, sensor kinase